MPDLEKMKFQIADSSLHQHKVLVRFEAVNYKINNLDLWLNDINFEINGNTSLHITGENGSGKTTIINLILNNIKSSKGIIYNNINKSIYIDQDYKIILSDLSVFQQAQQYNNEGLQEHEVKIKLTHFLFFENEWDKPCNVLSGGEKMRLLLCCLTMNKIQPELIILDEPSNNIDIQSTEILINTLNSYSGAMIVISHDQAFIESLKPFQKTLHLEKNHK